VADRGTALMLLFTDADLQWRCWNVNGGRREGEECAGLAGARTKWCGGVDGGRISGELQVRAAMDVVLL